MAVTAAQAGQGSNLFTSAIDRYAAFRSHIARRNMLFINQSIAEGNAELARKKVENLKLENQLNLAGVRREGNEVISTARALIGTSGVAEKGSPARAVERLAQNQEFRALAVEYAGSNRVSEMLAQAEQFDLEAVFAEVEANAEDRAAAFSDPFAYIQGKYGGSKKSHMRSGGALT